MENRAEDKTLFGTLVKAVLVIICFVFFSILVEWIVITVYYPEEGAWRSVRLIEEELNHLKRSELMSEDYGVALVSDLLNVQEYVFEHTISSLHLRELSEASRNSRVLNTGLSSIGLLPLSVYIASGINTINLLSVRILIVILVLPAFLLMMVWGLSIGLTRRSIRKYQVRNEASWLYHKAKAWRPIFIYVPVCFYLAWPNSLNPTYVFIVPVMLYAFAWLILASKFMRNWK